MGETLGRVHSVESFGSADGPGVRYIVFLKGCNMRCKYCHNPDTWAKCGENDGAKLMTPQEVLKTAMRYKAYWKQTGGITVSGGEALLQIDFVTELFKFAKEKGVNYNIGELVAYLRLIRETEKGIKTGAIEQSMSLDYILANVL